MFILLLLCFQSRMGYFLSWIPPWQVHFPVSLRCVRSLNMDTLTGDADTILALNARMHMEKVSSLCRWWRRVIEVTILEGNGKEECLDMCVYTRAQVANLKKGKPNHSGMWVALGWRDRHFQSSHICQLKVSLTWLLSRPRKFYLNFLNRIGGCWYI